MNQTTKYATSHIQMARRLLHVFLKTPSIGTSVKVGLRKSNRFKTKKFLGKTLCASESHCIDLNDKSEPEEDYACICGPKYNDNSNDTAQPADVHIQWQGISCTARS